MATMQTKEFLVKRVTCIGLGNNVKRLIALYTTKEYRIVRDDTRNKAFPNVTGYKIIHVDPIRDREEGALYYVDYHPTSGQLIFIQGRESIIVQALFSTT